MEKIQFSKEELRCIISIFVNIALILLPIFAADFPTNDRYHFQKLLIEWTKRSSAVIDHFLKIFEEGGPISLLRFVENCQKSEIFNVLKIREVAKQTAVFSNANPKINAEALADKDLFEDRLSQMDVNDGPPENLSEVQEEISEAVLYKVEKNAPNKLTKT